MKKDVVHNKFFQSLLLSAAGHLVLLVFFILLANYISRNDGRKLSRTIELQKVSQDLLNKLRTVGVKNGEKLFNMPVPSSPGQNEAKKSPIPQINLSDLQAKNAVLLKKTKGYKKSGKVDIPVVFKRDKGERFSDQALTKDVQITPDNAAALHGTGFNIEFSKPEGVSEDELNPMEKIYYSFQKRTFETYVSSFLHVYNNMVVSRPQVKKPLAQEQHTLVGKVTFDQEGNIVKIKMIQWSDNDDVQNLFEKTLQGIKSLPNPPKDLVKNTNEFTIYYQLKING